MKTVILYLLLIFFSIPEKVYCQEKNVENLYIYFDEKELAKTDKKLIVRIKPEKNDFVEIKGRYDKTSFYSKVYSSMFNELDSLKIFINSHVKKRKYVSIKHESYNKDLVISLRWITCIVKRYDDPSHLMIFYYTRKSEIEQSELLGF